ncbi:phosphatidylinositol 3-kinase catalytic subunit type 3 [Notechis scutatus]|uniref:Phosphatidylinositol 3-kinase catalytic subunit type 3 n=1 Tax=Notechis scutatus TaxID=8663 RepID=A0A6J1VEL3_9SAUR|nr:phosphatidylinositol 3-kinase catalytic subunit type 3 [Notechis scutatus]
MGETEKFYYVYSCDLDLNVQLKIGSLEGKREQKSYKAVLENPMLRFSGLYQETCSDLYVTCQVFAEGKPLALPVRTSYKAFSTRWNWNEWLKLPVKYPDLPRNAQVAFTIWDIYGPGKAVPVGGTTVSLFGKYGMFRQGMHDLKVWPNVEADGSEPTKTPGKTSSTFSEDKMSRLAKASGEEHLEELTKSHRQGHMVKVDWLDRLTFREIEMINEGGKETACTASSSELSPADSQIITSPLPLISSPLPTAKTKESAENENLEQDLCTFLISRACKNSTLGNYLYWYVIVECEDRDTQQRDPKTHEMYLNVMRRFSQALLKGDKSVRVMRSLLAAQQTFVDRLVHVMKAVHRENGNRKKKNDRLQTLLADNEKMNLSDIEPIPLPLEPQVKIRGIIPEKATLFKSALMPAQLFFKTEDGDSYPVIFKHGDDLRQDQLILQIISLMDKLLRKENLDLKLTPYKVLATSTKHGFMQFIQSVPVAEVLATEESIQNFFRKYAPSETGPHGISAEVMDTYVKSCAGYCVITYILGVGDRHLDNLLLTKTGKLFHIDFGYILGRDPKPLPPPMKLNKEMVEGMGGTQSEQYQEFRKQCYTAFLHLRRYSNLILNLFSLMVDANIPDIALEPDKTVKKVQDKFRLDLSDEEAVHYMQSLIDESVHALFAAMVEQIHKFAQYWRK